MRTFGPLGMDDAPLRADQLRERARLYREMTAKAVAPIVEAASSQWHLDTKLLPWSTTLSASERLPVGATFARGDTGSAGLRERMPAAQRVGQLGGDPRPGRGVGVGMLLGLDLGAFLGSLPRWAGATTTTSASVTVAALLSGLARDV